MRMILSAFLLSSCGLVTVKKYETVVQPGVDSAFFPHVATFEKLAEIKVHGQVAMWFNVEVDEVNAGECNSSTREVRVSWDKWRGLNNAQHENIVLHELAHCLLNRDHNDRTGTIEGVENAPVTLMNPKMIDPDTYTKLRAYYHQELFGRVLPAEDYEPGAFP